MNKQEKRLLEDLQKACLWLFSNAPEAYEASGIEPAIRALSAAAAMPDDTSSHRERLVEAIAPKVFDEVYGLFNDDSEDLKTSAGPILVAGITKRVVNAILEAENATNP